MKRHAIIAVAVLALPSLSHATFFQASLDGYQEVPSVATRAAGVFSARSNSDRSEVEYTLSYSNMQAPVTQAHIHFAQIAVNGPIVVWLCGSSTNPGPAGTPSCPQGSGSVSGIFRAADVAASPATQQLAAGAISAFIEAMRANSAYVNVHTTASPGGEIRGQVLGWGR